MSDKIEPKKKSTLEHHGSVFAQSVFEAKTELKAVKWPECLEKPRAAMERDTKKKDCGHCGANKHLSQQCPFIDHATGAKKHPNVLEVIGDVPFADVPQSRRYLELLTRKLREKNPNMGRATYLSNMFHMVDGELVSVREKDRIRPEPAQKRPLNDIVGPSTGDSGQKRKHDGGGTTPAPANFTPDRQFSGSSNTWRNSAGHSHGGGRGRFGGSVGHYGPPPGGRGNGRHNGRGMGSGGNNGGRG